jgi:class 3 adenylate cyclase
MPHHSRLSLFIAIGALLAASALRRAQGADRPNRPDPQPRERSPVAVNGVLSLTEQDLKAGVPLAGQWELYWGRLLTPEDFRGTASYPRTLVKVPGAWNADGTSFPPAGYATYRLVVLLPEGVPEPLGLYFKGVASSYRLFCNDAMIVENGNVSADPGEVRGTFAPQSVFLSARDRLEIILQVANAEDSRAGLIDAPRLGLQTRIAPLKSTETLVDAIIYSAILIMGLYHILLSLLHPAEKASLFFGILAVDLALRGALTGARILHQVAGGLGFHLLISSEYITVYLAALVIYFYFANLFPRECPRFARFPLLIVNGAFCVFVSVVPVWLISPFHFYYEIFLLGEGVLVMIWLLRSLAARREGAVIMLSGFFILLASAVYDIVRDMTHTGDFFLTSYAMVVFVFLQSWLIARRHALAYISAQDHFRRAEALATAYGRFVPREFLNLLGKESIEHVNLGDQIEMKLTVLFADIRSFTSLSEDLTPVENFNFLNSYLSRISPVIRGHGGFIDKYLGDGVMALFPRSPEDAVNAGLELLETVRVFNGHRANCGYRPIAISVGVNTGNLMLGTVGESSRMEGTVISDAVNLASRLEGLTRTFGAWIIVSGDLLEACPAVTRTPHRYLGRVRVKGKSRAVRIYEIIDRPDEGRVRTRETFEQALKWLEGRRYREAAAAFESVIAGDPSDSAARYYLKRLAAVTPPG